MSDLVKVERFRRNGINYVSGAITIVTGPRVRDREQVACALSIESADGKAEESLVRRRIATLLVARMEKEG